MSNSGNSGLFRRSSLPMSFSKSGEDKAFSSGTTGFGRSRKECFVFEPQQWRKTVCKNCFRTHAEHKSPGENAAFSSTETKLSSMDKGGGSTAPSTPTVSNTLSSTAPGTPIPSMCMQDPFKVPSQRETTNSNASRVAARKNAVGQRTNDEVRNLSESRRPISSGSVGSNIHSSVSSIDAHYIEELENDFFALEDKHEAILRERSELKVELESKLRTISELHNTLEQYREKVSLLERRSIHLEDEIKNYRERLRLPESDQSIQPATEECTVSGAAVDSSYSGELQQRLNEVESLCQEVMEENEQLKEEVEEMQREIEEMHDHFQEDDRDTMRELQRDLEAANKTCRILQFKLRKAERRFEQCDAERANLEERLARLEAELYSEADVAHIKNLEEEIRVAKEVGVRLNNELDVLDEKRAFFEEENRQLKEELQACHNRRIAVENELGHKKLEIEKLRSENAAALQVADKNRSSNAGTCTSANTGIPFEVQQLHRELEASRERETDVCEQLRYSEEEIRRMKRRLRESQMENEMAAKKMDRLLTMQLREPFAYGQTAVNRGPQEGQPIPGSTPTVNNQLEAELDMVKKQLEYMADENGELKRKLNSEEGQPQSERTTNSRMANEFTNLTSENKQLRNALKEWDKQLRVIVREVNLMNATEKDQEWMRKYSEALETTKEQEDQVLRLKKRLSELQDENSRLQAGERIMVQRQQQRRKRDKTGPSANHMSKESLCNEINNLEEELDEVSADLTAAREQASSAQLRATCLEETVAELRAETERRERELNNYIFSLENKCAITNRLLEVTRHRTDTLQAEVDKLTTKSEEVIDAALSGNGPQNGELEKLRKTVTFLEDSLTEETKRYRLIEMQLEQRKGNETNGCIPNDDSALKSKQIDLLKKELEEKDELLEAGNEQLSDMKVRLEQARKMNDALRALMEKEPDELHNSSPGIQKTELAVEVASYRKEMESLRKEMQILRTNLCQAKNLREKLAKENKELQEELKLREDSIFDQDDEIEKRTAEIQNLQTSMESLCKELEQTKQDLSIAKSRETSGSSGRISAQTEKLHNELNETNKQLNDMKRLYEESKRQTVLAEEKFNQTCTELNQFRSSMQDRESKIFDLGMSLKRVNDELHQARDQQQAIESEKAGLHQQLMETRNLLASREHELTKLHTQLLTSSRERSQESGLGLSDVSSREGTLSRRSADVDRLRRELSLMQRERDDLLSEVKRLRSNIEKQQHAKEFGQKDVGRSLLSLPTGNAYSKAIAAKQVTTKISLLNEHIAAVTKTNIELKLHNESMHNSVLDFQRRYRNLKEQYECEQEAWLTERVVLESKAKEQEDRKAALFTTRKLLQETSAKLSELETSSEDKLTDLQAAYKALEEEKISIETKLTQLEEQQNLPKVLQRFGASTTNSRGLIGASSRGISSDTRDANRRYESAERTIAKLRAELNEVRQSKLKEQATVLQETDHARQLAEQEAEDLRDRLVTMECYRQQTELFRHRQFEVEEMAEKEFKLWQEEREQLLSRCEEAKMMIEHWCTQLQYRTDSEAETADEVVTDVIKQMDKWRSSRGRVPSIKQRVMMDSTYSDGTSTVSVPAGPGSAFPRPGGMCLSFTRPSQAQRSTSMEWGNASSSTARAGGWLASGGGGGHFRESSLGLSAHGSGGGGGLRGSTLSLAAGGGSHQSLAISSRCGRSVSPEVSVKKISNYPDPTPGFLVRPNSRQGSQDSLCSIGDYTQRSFTLPGKPPMRSAISPARRRFFEDPPTEEIPAPSLPAILSITESLEDSSKDKDLFTTNTSVKATTMTSTRTENNDDKLLSSSTPSKTSTKNTKTEKDSKSSKTKKKSSESKLNGLEKKLTETTTTTNANNNNVISASKPESIVDRFSRWSGNSALKSVGKLGSTRSSSTEPKSAPKLTADSRNDATEKQTTVTSGDKTSRKKSETDKKANTSAGAPTTPTKNPTMTRSVSQPAPSITSSAQASTKASVAVSNISPAIMALRQKFSGGATKV